MHTKLSKEQKNVSQRLAEIEMQINDEEYRLVWPQLLSWRDQIENTFWDFPTLASGIDVGQGINLGLGKFGKKNKCRALNTMFYVVNSRLDNLYVLSDKAVGPGKKIKN